MFVKKKNIIEEVPNLSFREWELNLNDKLLNEFKYLKTIDNNKTYLLHLKYEELKKYIETKNNKQRIQSLFNKTQSFDDMIEFINNDKNDIQFILADKEPYKTDWLLLKLFVSTLYWSQNPGRNLRYLVQINGKYAGILSLGSDVIAMSERDNYIGWDKSTKIGELKRLNNTCIASSIVSTQPLGYMTTGGKLLSLLLFSNIFQKNWKERYNDTLAGITTTALYGIHSQYNGMPKYWKTLGMTKGKVNLSPMEETYSEIREYCLKRSKVDKEFSEKYNNAISSKKSTGDTKCDCATGPKQNILNLYYKESGFKDLLVSNNIKSKDLFSGFEKGIYFAKLYENTLDYLQGKINDDQLIQRKDLDFDVNDTNSIVDFWKRKYAKNRLLKTMELDFKVREKFFYDKIFETNTLQEFMNIYDPKNVVSD